MVLKYSGSSFSEENVPAWDGRQGFVLEMLEFVHAFNEAMRSHDFPSWLDGIKNTETHTRSHWKPEHKKVDRKDFLEGEEDEEEFKEDVEVPFETYDIKLARLLDVISKHRDAFIGEGSDDDKQIIELHLRDLTKYIHFKIKECGLYGSKRDDSGL